MNTAKHDLESIGFQASQVLTRNSSAEVYGTSRRGIYLQTPNDVTLFLSFENFKGPLTLNFSGDPGLFAAVKPGEILISELEESSFLQPDWNYYLTGSTPGSRQILRNLSGRGIIIGLTSIIKLSHWQVLTLFSPSWKLL